MIQIYSAGNENFDKNGDMTLFPTSCPLTCEINGAWELTMSHPLDDEGRWKYLTEEAVISCPTFRGDHQLFRVDKCEKTESAVQITAYPIFFDSADDCFLMDVRPTGQSGQQALNIMTAGSKYSGSSDITTGGTAYFVRRNLMDAINGEDSPTFCQVWGGEILYDNHQVIINERIGADKGAEIRYGKNMDGLTFSVNMADVVTRIIPVAYNGRTMSGDTPWVDSENIDKYAKKYIREVTFEDVKLAEDASDGDEDNGVIVCEDQADLNAALTQKCEEMYESGADLPAVTIEVSMIPLEQTDQYKDVEDLVSVALGDTVHCYNYRLNIETEARAIKMTWDCIRNRVETVTLGEYEYAYFNELTSSLKAIQKVIGPGDTLVAERVSGVLNAINTQLRYQKNIAQKQDVRAILFEDTDPDSPTYGAMCLGTQGFQIADTRTQDGSDWDWTTAFTAKGGYANTLIAGLLSDKTGKSYWNLDTGELKVSGEIISPSATITGGSFNVETGTDDYSAISVAWESEQGGGGRLFRKAMISPNVISKIAESYDSSGEATKYYVDIGSTGASASFGQYTGDFENPDSKTIETRISGGYIQCVSVNQTSDKAQKEDIKNISESKAREIILNAIPREYRVKGERGKRFGFVAQELKGVIGDQYETVKKIDGNEFISICYNDLIAPVIKILQIHDKEIKFLRGEKNGD